MTDHENTEPQAGPESEADDAAGASPAESSPAPQAPVADGVAPVGLDPQAAAGTPLPTVEPAEGGAVPAAAVADASLALATTEAAEVKPEGQSASEVGPVAEAVTDVQSGEPVAPVDQTPDGSVEGVPPEAEAVESVGSEDQSETTFGEAGADQPADPALSEGQPAVAPEAATPTEAVVEAEPEPEPGETATAVAEAPADSEGQAKDSAVADGFIAHQPSPDQPPAVPEAAEPSPADSGSADHQEPEPGETATAVAEAPADPTGQVEDTAVADGFTAHQPSADQPPEASEAAEPSPADFESPDHQEPEPGETATAVAEAPVDSEGQAKDSAVADGFTAHQPSTDQPPAVPEAAEPSPADPGLAAAPAEEREPGTVVLVAITDQIAQQREPGTVISAAIPVQAAEPPAAAAAGLTTEAAVQPQASEPSGESEPPAVESGQPPEVETTVLPAITDQPVKPIGQATEAATVVTDVADATEVVAAESLTTVLPPASGTEPKPGLAEPTEPTEPVPGAPQRVSVRPKRKSAKDKSARADLARAEAATPATGVVAAGAAKTPSALAMFETPPKSTRDPRRKRRRRRLVASLIVLALLVVAVGGVFGANLYFTNLAKPGVRLAGQDVSGKDADQIEQTAARLAKNYRLEISDGQTTVTATADQLGVAIDPAQSAAQVMAATDELPFWEALNPWQAKDIPLAATVDQAKLQQFLDQSFIAPEEEAVDATVVLGDDGLTFVAVPGMIGLLVDPDPVLATIDQALANGATGALNIAPEQRPPDIPDEAAEKAAVQANQALDIDITFTATDWRALLAELKLERGAIANWTQFNANPEDHTITVGYDQTAISTDVAQTLADQMAVPARPQLVVTRPDNGEDIGVTQWGMDGLKVADPDGIALQVADALDQGADATIPVELADDAFVTERKEAPSDFDVPNGSPWVDVNLSTFRATTYRGTTPVNSYIISTGASAIGRGTPTGTFYVYIKYEFQVMRGPESDPYEAPTNWVSYFTGGVAFHSAPWNEPNRWGMEVSHGCVNMQTWAAREVYDFAPIGTKVEVHR